MTQSMALYRPAGMIMLILATTACAPNEARQAASSQDVAAYPEAHYQRLQEQGRKVLHVDASQSLVAIEVRRAGALARFGHDHVVASHDIKGDVSPQEGRADLLIRLDQLTVDEAGLRAQAGFDTQPTPEDIAGTRHNMLAKVLEADRYPYALVRIERLGKTDTLRVAITLHGQTQTYQVPATIESTADRMMVSGTMHFNQSDFGIVPYSVLNGALRVQDGLDLRFRIDAHT
ncbi:MAG TPA: YceI family protein [Oxalicibacterium sp.]|jgi:polyisoprenoid-binding protein YceI|nr:YceI family protein [Oxalicibacterium sp.]